MQSPTGIQTTMHPRRETKKRRPSNKGYPKQPSHPSQNTKTLRRTPNLPHPLRALILHLVQADAQRRDKGQVHTGRHRHLIRLLTEQQFTGVGQLASNHGDDGVGAVIDDLGAGVDEVALQLEDGGPARGWVGDGCCGFCAEDCRGRCVNDRTNGSKEPSKPKQGENTHE